MIQAGGLIRLHYHDNLDILNLFSEVDNVLYYRNNSLFQNIQISEAEHNHLTKQQDGLFVDGTFLDRFSYYDNELYFDDKIVSREYTDQQITDMVNTLWQINPYLEIGKIDLTYWFENEISEDKTQKYKNNSDSNMNIKILNPEEQDLIIIIDSESNNYNTQEIDIVLPRNTELIIQESNNEDLNNITVNLVQ